MILVRKRSTRRGTGPVYQVRALQASWSPADRYVAAYLAKHVQVAR